MTYNAYVLIVSIPFNSSKPKDSAGTTLISKIISAQIVPIPSGKLENNVTFTMTHEKQSEGQISCAFINKSESNYSTKGCSITTTDDYRTGCTCDHMTSFAIITRTKPTEQVSILSFFLSPTGIDLELNMRGWVSVALFSRFARPKSKVVEN